MSECEFGGWFKLEMQRDAGRCYVGASKIDLGVRSRFTLFKG